HTRFSRDWSSDVCSSDLGFFYERPESPLDSSFYHPERELFWTFTNRVAPAYYGEPTFDLADLGRKISQDPRLVECATQQVFEGRSEERRVGSGGRAGGAR